MTTLEMNTWTGRNGQVRRYVNNWEDVVGLEITRYNTGNIAHATLDGEHISNTEATRITKAKVWIDDQDQVHVDRPGVRNAPPCWISKKIAAALAEQS